MAYRKQMFEKYGLFRTDLGPSPNKEVPRPNEDGEFGNRLLAAGEQLRYEPSAVVFHPVPEERLRKEYFLAWYFDWGRAVAREIGRGPDILGLPRFYFNIPVGMGRTALGTVRWMIEPNSPKRFFLKGMVWYSSGRVVELFRLLRQAR